MPNLTPQNMIRRRGRPPLDWTDPDVLSRYVDADGDCWLWRGYIAQDGYGQTGRGPAHRAVYLRLVGDIPAETLDHLCRVRHCVNPDHLEPVSRRENILRGYGPGAQVTRTGFCRRGHAMDAANSFYQPGRARRCLACFKAAQRRSRERKQTVTAKPHKYVSADALERVQTRTTPHCEFCRLADEIEAALRVRIALDTAEECEAQP